MPQHTSQDPESSILDDAAEECDRLSSIITDLKDDPEPNAVEISIRGLWCAQLQALSFYRMAIALENLGAEATDELMQATLDHAATFDRAKVPRLPKKHAGG